MPSLCDLGLGSYEEQAYLALLDLGPATAKEVAEASDVPMGRVYDALNGIEAREIARSQSGSRPRKYVAVEPEVAVDRLLDAKRQELAERRERYESVADTLRERLQSAGRSSERFWTAAVGPEDTLDLLLERIDAADDRVLLAVDAVADAVDLDEAGRRTLDRLADAVERGAEVSVLVDVTVVDRAPEGLVNVLDEAVFDDEGFDIRTTEHLHGGFVLLDSSEVCMEFANPANPTEAFALIDLRDVGFAAEVEAAYLDLWADADPLGPAED